MIRTICRNCHHRARLVRGLCRSCQRQLGHYKAEEVRQETAKLGKMAFRFDRR